MDVAAYARWNGLTVDSLVDAWPPTSDDGRQLSASIDPVEPGETYELECLEEPLFYPIIPLPEQLQVPASSIQFIHQACHRPDEQEASKLMLELCLPETNFKRTHKMELMALRSDHESDCSRLRKRILRMNTVDLQPQVLLEHADLAAKDGLSFPVDVKRGDDAIMASVEKESLELEKASVAFLVRSLKVEFNENDKADLLGSLSTYTGVRAREYLTPPLSPEAEDIPDYFIPAASDCEIPAPSEVDSRLSEDIAEAETKIFAEDNAFWNAAASKTPRSPERYDDLDIAGLIKAGELSAPSLSPLATPPKHLPRDLKLDVPLILSDDSSGHDKPARVLDPKDLAQARALVNSSDPITGADEQLADFLQGKAVNAMRSAEQESLEPLDALARMPVPVMDFTLPHPEWAHVLWEPQAMYRWIRERSNVNWQGPKWAYGKVSDKLSWVPVRSMAKPFTRIETIESATLERLLEKPNKWGMLKSSDFVAEPRGLLVFRQVNNDDSEAEVGDDVFEFAATDATRKPAHNTRGPSLRGGDRAHTPIQPGNHQMVHRRSTVREELDKMIRTRKRSLDEMVYQQLARTASAGQMQPLPDFASTDVIDCEFLPSTDVLRGYAYEYTDFKPLVANYLEINAPRKKAKLTHTAFFGPPSTPTPAGAQQQFTAIEVAKLMPPPPVPVPAVAPEIHPPQTPPRAIVSANISPMFTTELKRFIPSIGLIQRDHGKYRPRDWVPGSCSPNMDEADLIVSPATGILMTTLVKLRQKTLPGTIGQFNYRNVVKNVAERYERLVILVSECNKHSETMSPLGQSDAKALAEFQGFAAGLDTEIHLCYVGGGNQTLAKWAAAAICKYAAEGMAVQNLLLPIETGWEMFMCLAGMNTYAAQVALAILKVPDDDNGPAIGQGRLYGLPLFVTMTREERVARLGKFLRGEKVLNRVSEVLDEPWGQCAVGNMGNVL
ncbi:hypothetical protein OQA88_2877 [Cercophora sp. LCS_1]